MSTYLLIAVYETPDSAFHRSRSHSANDVVGRSAERSIYPTPSLSSCKVSAKTKEALCLKPHSIERPYGGDVSNLLSPSSCSSTCKQPGSNDNMQINPCEDSIYIEANHWPRMEDSTVKTHRQPEDEHENEHFRKVKYNDQGALL